MTADVRRCPLLAPTVVRYSSGLPPILLPVSRWNRRATPMITRPTGPVGAPRAPRVPLGGISTAMGRPSHVDRRRGLRWRGMDADIIHRDDPAPVDGEPDLPPEGPADPGRRALPVPWDGPIPRADRIIVGGIALAGLYSIVLLPLFPVLSSSHPALLELVRPSPASIVNMGARAGVGQTTFLLALLLGVPSLMMFDWLFWWAGKRWGDRVFVWLLGSEGERAKRRVERLHRLERRFGAGAVVLAYIVPVPSTLIYAAVGDGGMRLRTFLALDLLGTLLWAGLLATLGYELGQRAVDVTDAIAHYSLLATLGVIAAVIAAQAVRSRIGRRPPGTAGGEAS